MDEYLQIVQVHSHLVITLYANIHFLYYPLYIIMNKKQGAGRKMETPRHLDERKGHGMKHLYVMRHGETLFNKKQKIQGWCDSPLTEMGIAQAKAAGKLIKDVPFDHYYSSTQERACDTLEYAVGHDVHYERLKGLKERNFGLFEGETEYINPIWKEDFGYDDLFPHYDGELELEFVDRMRKTIDAFMEKDDHENVLIVTHAGAGTFFVRHAADDTLLMEKGGFKNGYVMHLTYDGGAYTLVEVITPEVQ